jgi:hypothetical protein
MLKGQLKFVKSLPGERQYSDVMVDIYKASRVVAMLDLCILLHQALSTNETATNYTTHSTVQIRQLSCQSLPV